MKSKAFVWAPRIVAVLVLAVSVGMLAENPDHKKFIGFINAYSPQSPVTGPYEVRGPWSMTFNREATKANFSAALNMELSDGWVITKNAGNFDPNARGAHTHHITLVDADVTRTATGYEICGPATITLNGGSAPVSPSPLVIEITGGTEVEYSNITLTFGLPGSAHFGTEPLSGVVRKVEEEK